MARPRLLKWIATLFCLAIISLPISASAISADPPVNPILFAHGLFGSSNGTFGTTTQFLEQQLGWTNGGNLKISGNNFSIVPENFNADGDFFTLDFGDKEATYPDGQGLIHQAGELEAIIDFLQNNGVEPVVLFGHSNGGLASRYYLAHHAQATTKVKKYISYGTPHRGADLSFFGGPSNHGVRDTFYRCNQNQITYVGQNLFGELVNNQFLTNLSQDTLPQLQEGYVTIIGGRGGERSPNCHNTDIGDSTVARTSQDLREVDNPPTNIRAILTDHLHTGQGNHVSAVMCGLDHEKCATFSARYSKNISDPVTLQVVSPSGQIVREGVSGGPSELIQISGADLMKVPDEGSITIDTVMVPFAESGVYKILLSATAGASPTSTFSLVVDVGDAKIVLAQNMQVQNIPSGGFSITMPYSPVQSDFNSNAMSDILAVHTDGTLVAGLLNNSALQTLDFLLQADPAQGWSVHATADFDGDNQSDILLTNTTTGEYRVVTMNGSAVASDTVVVTLDPAFGLEPRGVGDFNGDGFAEIIVHHPPSGYTALMFFNGGGFASFEDVTVIDAANNWTLKDTGDFNQDGKTDLMTYNTVTGETAVIEMNGATPTATTPIFSLAPATGWTVESNGDFNGDGKTDVLILHTSGALGVLVMDGLVFQSIYIPGALQAGWELVNVGNYDTLAQADFLIHNVTTGDLMTAIQDGTTITSINTVLNLGAASGWSYNGGRP